ncbi:MAG: aldo/keto reductase [Selenomonadaceae bacterium]|nr:aldo/keto reductase [Selenomonadaceae bacterium]
MKYRVLGKDLKVSAVGLGCMGMSHAYGMPSDHKEMANLIAAAVDIGYTFFDTAECYGTEDDSHDNEKLVGKALKPYRDKVVIATKCGVYFDKSDSNTNKAVITDARPETIRKSVEESLRRLQTDYIDLYYQHRQDPKIPVEEVAGVMSNLIDEGKILHWGLSEVGEDVIRRAHKVCHVTAVQNRYSMMARHYEPLFPVFEELSIGLVAFSPMANGLLSTAYGKNENFDAKTDYRSVMPQFTAEAMDKNRELFALLKNTAEKKNATPAQISLAWMIEKKPFIVPIPGTRKLSRLKENAGAADISLTAKEIKALDDALNNMEMSAVFGGAAVKAR